MKTYADYGSQYLPGEYYRSTYGDVSSSPFYRVMARGKQNIKFSPTEETSMQGESFQRFLNISRNPAMLYAEAVKYPQGFTDYMNFVNEFS